MLENVKRGVREFFNLPMEEKMQFQQRQGDVEGYGQLLVFSEDQKLEWGDMLYMLTLPPEMRKPHLLPNLPFRFSFSLIFALLLFLSKKMYYKLYISLNIDLFICVSVLYPAEII